MIRPISLWIGCATAAAMAAVALFWPLEVRHSAPFGFSLTLDTERGLAVRGGYVVANYPNFGRVDLDLRAYTPAADYDLTVYIRPAEPGAPPIRAVPLPLAADDIWHAKGAFADAFVSVRFPPIADAAARRYYVWVEPGPRNRDDVVTLWSIKSYSRVTGFEVLRAALGQAPAAPAPWWRQLAVGTTLAGVVVAFGWLIGALINLAIAAVPAALRPGAGGHDPALERRAPMARVMRWNARRSHDP